jgi:hypothetical protein
VGRSEDGTGATPITGQGRGPTHAERFGTDHGDGQLAVNQLKAFFFALLETLLQNRIVFELYCPIALDTDDMVVVVGIGLVEFVMFMALCQFQFSQNAHARH